MSTDEVSRRSEEEEEEEEEEKEEDDDDDEDDDEGLPMNELECKKVEGYISIYRDHIASCVVLVRDAIKGLFLINGMGVTVILTMKEPANFRLSLLLFIIGVALSIVLNFLAYFYQHNVADSWKWAIGDYAACPFRREKSFFYACTVCALASFCFFASACYFSVQTL